MEYWSFEDDSLVGRRGIALTPPNPLHVTYENGDGGRAMRLDTSGNLTYAQTTNSLIQWNPATEPLYVLFRVYDTDSNRYSGVAGQIARYAISDTTNRKLLIQFRRQNTSNGGFRALIRNANDSAFDTNFAIAGSHHDVNRWETGYVKIDATGVTGDNVIRLITPTGDTTTISANDDVNAAGTIYFRLGFDAANYADLLYGAVWISKTHEPSEAEIQFFHSNGGF